MTDERQEELRKQEDDRRGRRVAAELRLLQQERQPQDESHRSVERPTEEHYAQLPAPRHTGIR